MACRTCKFEKSELTPKGDLTSRVSDYQTSSESGCRFCRMILDALEVWKPGWAQHHRDESGIQLSFNRNRFDIYLRARYGMIDRSLEKFSIFQSQDDAAGLRLERPFHSTLGIIKNTFSEAAYSRASTWLSNCVASHPGCRPMDPVFKPRRLVDVGLDRTREPVLLEPIEHCRYAALSYCWGKDLVDVLTTRKQNLDSNLKAIPLSSMPRTIQDAVVFCRGVKIQYIWIDSLCIVQDDDEDWLAESARMCEIYSNSYFTIAAQNAPSCKSGFLGQQKYGEVSWQRPFWTEFGQRDGSESLNKMYVRGPEPTVRMALYGRSNFSLQGRGWTLQENLLSTRIIHFTGNEMIWECDNRDFCECGHVDDLDYYEPGAMSKQALKRWRESSPQKFLGRNTWIKITEDYSNRMLTQERDKLVAISGLAKRTVIDVNKDTSRSLEEVSGNYLAGLWRDDLPINLLWHTDSGESSITSHKRPAKYRGPTWSWVSIDGPVRYSQIPAFAEEESHLAISESRCSPASPWNPLGPVTSGHLILSGLLVPVQLAITDEKPPVGYYGAITTEWRGQAGFVRARNLVPYQISLDLPSVINLKREDPTYQCWINRHEVEKCPHPTDCDFEETEKVFYCLKVASFYFPPRPPIIQYLVLTKSSTDPEQAYERVGIGAWGKWWPPPLDFHLFDGADVTTTTIKIF